MKREISKRELRQIRKAIEAVPGRYDTGAIIPVAIALPNPCDDATRSFAYLLIERLKTVNCDASINFVLSFSRYITSDKPYEVLTEIPLGSPCIRVFAQKQEMMLTPCQKIRKAICYWQH